MKRREANWPPPPPHPRSLRQWQWGDSCKLRDSEGLPESVGEVQITWDGCGAGTELDVDLCFRKLKRPGTGFPLKSSLGEQ